MQFFFKIETCRNRAFSLTHRLYVVSCNLSEQKIKMRYVKKKFESPTGLEHPPITRRVKNLYSWFATKWQGGHGRGQIKTIN